MGRNKRLQKKRNKSRKNSSAEPVFIPVENPFQGIPKEELTQLMLKVGRSYDSEFEESLSKLTVLIRAFDPLHLISILSVYGLFSGLTGTGKIQKKKLDATIQQSHVEIAQAIALTIPAEDISAIPALPENIQEIWDLLILLSKAFHLKRLAQIEQTTENNEKAILQLQEHLRLHTQFVRNWGYFNRVISITKELFEPLDSLYKKSIGLGATQLIQLFEHLVKRGEMVINERYQGLRAIYRAHTIEETVRAYYLAFPHLEGSPEESIKHFHRHKSPREAVFAILLSHHDLQMPEVFTFDIPGIAIETGLGADDLRQALPKLSHRFGGLHAANHEHFFLGNPVWIKPLVQISDDTYFCATPQIFFSFIFPLLQDLLDDNVAAQELCAKRKADYLEERMAKLLLRAFEDSEYVRNFKWQHENIEYESDMILKVDSYLFLVEAKSGAVTSPALRGAPDRARRHVQELLLDPAQQSKRLAAKLESARSGEDTDQTILDQLPFDIGNVQKIIRLSVTLEDFATIQSNIFDLKSTGWLDIDFPVTPTMTLADLEVVMNILDSTPSKIHYLIRRSEMEDHMTYKGDELDLLGVYLDTTFNFGEAEFSGNSWVFVGMSKKVDDYYIAQDYGITRKKPTIKSTQWWIDIQKRIGERRINRWSEAAVMLFNVSFEDQRSAQNQFNKIIKNVKKNWRRPGHKNTVIISPPPRRTDAFALMAFRDRQKEDRHNLMENAAAHAFSNDHATRCLVIGVNIDKDQYPYSILGVFDRPKDMAQ